MKVGEITHALISRNKIIGNAILTVITDEIIILFKVFRKRV